MNPLLHLVPHYRDRTLALGSQPEMATIEQESKDQTGYQSEVVTLYQGGEYSIESARTTGS